MWLRQRRRSTAPSQVPAESRMLWVKVVGRMVLGGKDYPLVMSNIAMENGPFIVEFPIKMVIFHSYVNLPEGNPLWLW